MISAQPRVSFCRDRTHGERIPRACRATVPLGTDQQVWNRPFPSVILRLCAMKTTPWSSASTPGFLLRSTARGESRPSLRFRLQSSASLQRLPLCQPLPRSSARNKRALLSEGTARLLRRPRFDGCQRSFRARCHLGWRSVLLLRQELSLRWSLGVSREFDKRQPSSLFTVTMPPCDPVRCCPVRCRWRRGVLHVLHTMSSSPRLVLPCRPTARRAVHGRKHFRERIVVLEVFRVPFVTTSNLLRRWYKLDLRRMLLLFPL